MADGFRLPASAPGSRVSTPEPPVSTPDSRVPNPQSPRIMQKGKHDYDYHHHRRCRIYWF